MFLLFVDALLLLSMSEDGISLVYAPVQNEPSLSSIVLWLVARWYQMSHIFYLPLNTVRTTMADVASSIRIRFVPGVAGNFMLTMCSLYFYSENTWHPGLAIQSM